MSQSLSAIYVHIIFASKENTSFLDSNVTKELYPYITKVIIENDSELLNIGGFQNHIHILCKMSKNISIAKLLEEIKTSTSRFIKTLGNSLGNFYWQRGYGVFSVSQSQLKKVSDYISNQNDHHRVMTFEEEFTNFIKKYEVKYNEKYYLI